MSDRVTSVRTRLGDPEPEVRRLATQEIPGLPAPDSCDLLLVALGDGDWRVRKEAAAIAARVEPRTAVVFAVARVLGDRDDIGLRNAAVEALVAIGPDAVPGAIDALSRLDADGRKLAVEMLAGAPTLSGMRALVKSLGDVDPNVVVAATEGLGRADLAGDEARELATIALTKLLSSGSTPARLAALESLRKLQTDVPWPALEPLFNDPLLRRPAIAAAGGSLVPRAVRALAEACADPSPTLSREAVIALGLCIENAWGNDELLDVAAKTLRASTQARTRLRALARASDSESGGRGAAVLALGLIRDPDDVALIADALADDAVADRAEAALRLFGEEAVEPLLVAGRTGAPSLRGATLSMLPQLASREPTPLAAVREALLDPSSEVVAPALKSLAIVGGPSDLQAVARHVTSADPKVAGAATAALLAIAARHLDAARAAATGVEPRGDGALTATLVLGALARAGATLPEDAAFLASALSHREAAVRRGAIEALAAMGGEDAAAAVTLSLADEEPMVANAAIRALGRLGRGEQLALLAATTRDPIRLGAVLRALKDADPERAFAAARPLLRSREAAVAAAAVEVVGAVAVEARVDALMGAADHPDHEVAKLALAQLANTGDERALAALAHALEHDAEAVRRYAAELLGQEGGVEAEGLLRARLDRERSAEVRFAIMTALSTRPQGEGNA
ncbi:MAG TPA: HEAT repeat domain-containing protein [Labilithrix sp.]|nr:HEAT repeat domain-containing protein [Labilithrix sp.]